MAESPKIPSIEQSIIFINHRRTDAGWTASLVAKELRYAFGEAQVFQDAHEIHPGDDLSDEIMANLRRTAVLIVLVGKDWLGAHDEYKRRRLDNENDWVRREIRHGLEEPDCKVIPVLLDEAELPDQPGALPGDIGGLLGLKRTRIRQADFDADFKELIQTIENYGFQRLKASRERGTGFPSSLLDDLKAHLETHLQANVPDPDQRNKVLRRSFENCRALSYPQFDSYSSLDMGELVDFLGDLYFREVNELPCPRNCSISAGNGLGRHRLSTLSRPADDIG